MLSRLLSWIDASPARYWWLAWTAVAVVVALAVAQFLPARTRAWWRHPGWFAGAMLLCIFAFRWPVLFDNRQLPDPDESQMIAGAMTLRHDPMFWRSVDGTTHGPIADWPLLVAGTCGARFDYTNARTISALLVWLASLSAWLVFRRLFGAAIAGILVLPLLVTDAFCQAWMFVAFCSEHVPAGLVAIGCAALLLAWDENGHAPRRLRLLIAGVAFGAAPFAKLQAAPIVAVALLGGVLLLLATNTASWRSRWQGVAAMTAGACVMPAVILLMVMAGGIWADFWQCFVVNNLTYAGARWFTWAETPAKLIEFVGWAENFKWFFHLMLVFTAVGLLLVRWAPSWPRRCMAFAAAVLIAALYAAAQPGRPFPHYLQLTTFPLGLCGGLAIGAAVLGLRQRLAAKSSLVRFAAMAVLVVFALCTVVPQIVYRAQNGQPYLGRFAQTRGRIVRSAAAQEILHHARPGEAMAIWGWMPAFWVETGLIQGTRDGNAARQIDPNPDREYYRARFVADLRRVCPRLFVDSVGEGPNFGLKDRPTQAHEVCAELRDYVTQNYHLVSDVEGTRIYVRNSRK